MKASVNYLALLQIRGRALLITPFLIRFSKVREICTPPLGGLRRARVNEIVVGVEVTPVRKMGFEVNKGFGASEEENILILMVIRLKISFVIGNLQVPCGEIFKN